MPITFQKTSKQIVSVVEDSPIVNTSLQINVDAAKLSSYPGYGTNWADISGNGYNYSLVGDVTFDSANGGSLNFQNGAKATSPNFGGFSFSGDFTYEVWINSDSLSGNILSERDGGGWTVALMELVNGEVRVGYWRGAVSYITIGTIEIGKWYQIVMKYNAGTLTGYINGQVGYSLGGLTKQYPGDNYYITIADYEPTNFGGGNNYTGKISSVKFYNTALSDTDILQNYNSLKYRYINAPFESNTNFLTTRFINNKDGVTALRAGSSAYQIKRDFPSSTDGLYWIKNSNINNGEPFQIYADMTTDGGGWTLILTNVFQSGWTIENAIHRVEGVPSLSENYSIVDWADYIKKSPYGFQYMIDATERGRWGGIWTANGNYSFINGDNSQTDITLDTKFDNWNYNNNGVEERMPWYTSNEYPTLTTNTNGYNDNAWWGTLVTTNASFNPTPWMGNENPNPGILWYWVR